MFIFIFFLLLSTASAKVHGDDPLVRISISIFFPVIVLRFSIIKFAFFVDVLHHNLDRVKQVLLRKKLSHDNMKSLSKAFTLCWELNKCIDRAFASTLLYNTFLTYIGALFSTYNMLVGISANKLSNNPFYTIFSIAYTIYLTYHTCKKCTDCVGSIAALRFSRNCVEFHGEVESFALQLRLQKISFEPPGCMTIDYRGLVRVSSSRVRQFISYSQFFKYISTLGAWNNRFLQYNFVAILFGLNMSKHGKNCTEKVIRVELGTMKKSWSWNARRRLKITKSTAPPTQIDGAPVKLNSGSKVERRRSQNSNFQEFESTRWQRNIW